MSTAAQRNGAGLHQVVDLDELLPSGLEFVIAGVSYPVPGDLPVPLVLRIQQVMERMAAVQLPPEGATAEQVDEHNQAGANAILEAVDLALEVLRLQTPDAEPPLGVAGTATVLAKVLEQVGGAEAVVEADAARPTRAKAPRRARTTPPLKPGKPASRSSKARRTASD